jgi:hypothetical protein
MKRKIRNIYIDGMEKSGKTSVVRQMRSYLISKNKELCQLNGVDLKKLKEQEDSLENIPDVFILKENSLLNTFYNDRIGDKNLANMADEHSELLRREVSINHEYGAVHFFILPEDVSTAEVRLGSNGIPEYFFKLLDFYKNINSISLTQGLNIELVFFDEFDRIYDVRDKILDIIDQKYEI